MKIIRYPQHHALQQSSSVTIGNFDGLHKGHQDLIAQVVKHAKAHDHLAVVVTMQPMPAQYFQGPDAVEVLTPFKTKYQLLKAMGVDVMCNLNFNRSLANMSATDFYQQILRQGLNSQFILVGDDFRFGAGRSGDFALLQQLSVADQLETKRLQSIMQGEQRVSSTMIRAALRAGDFALAAKMLGRHYSVIGRVAHGKKLGRKLGYPTINIELKHGAFPLHGIYAVNILIGGVTHAAVASVGFNPTVEGRTKRLEVYVLDFDRQVYGQCVEVLFYKKLRNEVEFDSLTALISAIDTDVQQTREFFANFKGELV